MRKIGLWLLLCLLLPVFTLRADGSIRLGRGEVTDLAVSPDGSLLAAASTVGVWLYNAADLNAPPRHLDGHSAGVNHLAFRPDGTQLLSGGDDNLAILWALPEGKPTPLKGHTKPITAIAYSANGALIATAAQEIRLWEAATGKGRGILSGDNKLGTLYSLAFSPDGSQLISGGSDGQVRVWDVTNKALISAAPSAKKAGKMAFAPDGKAFYFAADDSVWAWEPGAESPAKQAAFDGENMSAAAFTANLTSAAYASSARKLHLVRLPDLKIMADLSLESAVRAAAFSPDGNILYTSSSDNAIRAVNPKTGKASAALIGVHGQPTEAVALSVDSTLAAFSVDGDTLIRVTKTASGELVKLIDNGVTATGIVFTADGQIAATAGRDVRLYQAERGIQSGTLATGGKGRLTLLAIGADGKRLAAADIDGVIYVWEAGRGKLTHTLKGHTDTLSRLFFSADGTQVISAADDGTVRIWTLSE